MDERSTQKQPSRVLKIAITGVSSPLGLCFAQWAILRDHQVVGLYRKTARQVRALGDKDKLRLHSLDLSDTQQINEAAIYIQNIFGHLDVLINNASGWHYGGISSSSDQEICDQVTASIAGTLLLTRSLIEPLANSQRGLIINICSTVGSGYRFSSNTLYVTLKGAMESFGRALRNDLRSRGIRVTNLHLGKLATAKSKKKRVPLSDVIRMVDALVGCSQFTSVDSVVITPIDYHY